MRARLGFAALAAAVLGAAGLAGLASPPAAGAGAAGPIPASLIASCRTETAAPGQAYRFCDDGVPARGGARANRGGVRAVRVPAAYGGYVGLPAKSKRARRVPGADGKGMVALDVDISYPAAASGPVPLIFLMHGCCSSTKVNWEAQDVPEGRRYDAGGELWHFNNAWFASRGYVVVNHTARGFMARRGHGSTGQTHLDSRSFEINDFQALACAVTARFNTDPALPDVAPSRVVASGGSYGGTFAWLAATDPKWRCRGYTGAAGTRMRLAAAAPRYGWTDLAYALAPTGTHSSSPGRLPATNGCDSLPWNLKGRPCRGRSPIGIPKTTLNTVLYGLGVGRYGPGRTTFTKAHAKMLRCLTGAYPPRGGCAGTLRRTLPELLRESSPYFQNRWFRLIRRDPGYRVPVFDAATLTDPLFGAIEEVRMINRIRRAVKRYPIQAYFGDYHHFNNNKPRVWADTCPGGGICRQADYSGGVEPIRIGVTTRLNRFIDHFARPAAAPSEPRPAFNVTAELQVCPQNARDLGVPFNRGGPQFQARTFAKLFRRTFRVRLRGGGATRSTVPSNPHAQGADPVKSNGARCRVERRRAGKGTATFRSRRLEGARTVIGMGRVDLRFRASGNPAAAQLAARLYDVLPGGKAVLVDRGARLLSRGEFSKGRVSFQLNGNAWRFGKGHRVRLEVTQDDSPFLQRSRSASRMRIRSARLALPAR